MALATTDPVFDAAAGRFALLATPTRLRIVCALVPGERNVGALAEAVGTSQPNVSRHLGEMRRGGVLARRRSGLHTFYRLADERVALLRDAMCAQCGSAKRCALACRIGEIR